MTHSPEEAAHTMKQSGLPVTYGALRVFGQQPEIIRELLREKERTDYLRTLWSLPTITPLTLEETVNKAKAKARDTLTAEDIKRLNSLAKKRAPTGKNMYDAYIENDSAEWPRG